MGDLGARWALRRAEVSTGWTVLFSVGALLVLALMRLVPIAGALISLLALVCGLGAWTQTAYRYYQR